MKGFMTLIFIALIHQSTWAQPCDWLANPSCIQPQGKAIDPTGMQEFDWVNGEEYPWGSAPLHIGFRPWVPNPSAGYEYQWFANTSIAQVEQGLQYFLYYDTPILNLWDADGGSLRLHLGQILYVRCQQVNESNGDVVNFALWRVLLWKPGDANGDLMVDEADQAIVMANYGQSGKAWWHGDFDGDGWVKLNDLQILATYWGS